ncbi:hypothetical protein M2418_000424 [Rhizobium sp. BIGb0125]|nr:hypothetical protein [Rhizobium sp. BIGb0125]
MVSPASSAEAHPARGQLPDFPRPILGARPETPDVEKVPLSEIRSRNLIRHQELYAVQEANKKLLKERQKRARKENLCTALVKAGKKDRELGREKDVCGTFATNHGLCRKHYNLKYLKVPPIQPGAGATMRPFAGWQLPGNMTEKQHEGLRALPLRTSYADCLEVLIALDPSNILEAICEKPASMKSKP